MDDKSLVAARSVCGIECTCINAGRSVDMRSRSRSSESSVTEIPQIGIRARGAAGEVHPLAHIGCIRERIQAGVWRGDLFAACSEAQ